MTDPEGHDLPPALRERLARLWDPGPPPPAVGDSLGAAARAHLRPPPWRRGRPLLLAGAGAAAAALLLALWLGGRGRERDLHTALAPADVNGDRVVDILDARDLARHLLAGHRPQPRWDVNGDGTVDAADVDAVALEAVRIDR